MWRVCTKRNGSRRNDVGKVQMRQGSMGSLPHQSLGFHRGRSFRWMDLVAGLARGNGKICDKKKLSRFFADQQNNA